MIRVQGQPVAARIPGEYVWHHLSEEARSPTQEERWLRIRRCALAVEPFGDTNLLVAMSTVQRTIQELPAIRTDAVENWPAAEMLALQVPTDRADDFVL